MYDMPTSMGFYRDAPGFQVVSTSGEAGDDDMGWPLPRLNGDEVMLNTANEPGRRPPTPDLEQRAAHEDVSLYFECP